ncbi:MAG: hypothetical protein ACOYKM_03450 [Caulobacterales bacterium]|jgi:hypothetical protein
MSDGVRLTPDQLQARKRRNAVLGWLLFVLMLLVFGVTVSQLGAAVLDRPL